MKNFLEHQEKLANAIAPLTKVAELVSKLSAPIFPAQQLAQLQSCFIDQQKNLSAALSKFQIPHIPNLTLPTLGTDLLEKFCDAQDFVKSWQNPGLFEQLKRSAEIFERLKNNPELEFLFITSLEVLGVEASGELISSLGNEEEDKFIREKEELLSRNLVPILERFDVKHMWDGATYALESEENPDRLRHALVSLRSILEFFFNSFEPKEETRLNKKLKAISSNHDLGWIEEFRRKDEVFLRHCFSLLSNLHNREVGLSKNQVRILKVKTGITAWFFGHLLELAEEEVLATA